MWMAIGIVLFALGLLFSIAWHELGHLSFAKLFNVRTTQYMVGFGKTLWSKKVGETEYGFKAIPLGGYIKMVGMVPPDKHGRQRITSTAMGPAGFFRQIIEDARSGDRALVQESDDGRQFYQLHPFKRIIIMFAGPFMNLVLAVVLFGIVMVTIGTPTASTSVQSVSACVVPATASAAAQDSTDCAPAQWTPARVAGVQPGDTITSFDQTPVTSWAQLTGLIEQSAGKTVAVTVLRGGQPVELSVPIVLNERYVYDETGRQILGTHQVGFFGIAPQVPYVTHSFGSAFDQTGRFIGAAAQAVVRIPSRIPGLWHAIFGAERSIDSPVGIVGAGRISGEILAQNTEAKEKAALFLTLLAGFNMSLFLLNLLPLLPLDGGHILGALIEWIRRGWAKLFGRPRPAPFDVAKLMPVAYVVALLFIGLTVLTLVADIVNPLTL